MSNHDDYLDPDKSGMFEENWSLDFESVKQALKGHDTGRWDWSQIDCCLTGKDADLEPWGDQGIQLVSCNEEGFTFIVHGYKSMTGIDICLNLTAEWEENDELWNKAREAYLEQAQGVVMGTFRGYEIGTASGEWDGDDWAMSFEAEVTIPWVFKEDTVTPDYEATANAIHEKAQEVIKPWEDEMTLANGMLEQLAGWHDTNGEHCPEGQPSDCAAWMNHEV